VSSKKAGMDRRKHAPGAAQLLRREWILQGARCAAQPSSEARAARAPWDRLRAPEPAVERASVSLRGPADTYHKKKRQQKSVAALNVEVDPKGDQQVGKKTVSVSSPFSRCPS